MQVSGFNKAGTIYYKHLIDIIEEVNGNNFNTRVTLYYGFYQKTPYQKGYIIPNEEHVFMFPQGWYFGVNLRIKCEQAENIHPTQVQRANNFYNMFNQPNVFPQYVNGRNDKGVDFFDCPNINQKLLEKLMKDYNAEAIMIDSDFEVTINADNYEEWLLYTLQQMEDWFNQVN